MNLEASKQIAITAWHAFRTHACKKIAAAFIDFHYYESARDAKRHAGQSGLDHAVAQAGL
jgi:hypothetical protein